MPDRQCPSAQIPPTPTGAPLSCVLQARIQSAVVASPRHLPKFAKTRAAMAYADAVHDGQRRRVDDAPFILHPLEVASLLQEAGGCDELVAAGVLHDTIEKTNASASDLRKRFGRRVTELVLAVTEDKRIKDYAKR